ncbi:MAG: phosphoglycerate dehydrogenase [Erysipelotrichaceae bacterium]|nr:phosphoglycerate dehydrogenase [Erysipelotrichaceae bacterium]
MTKVLTTQKGFLRDYPDLVAKLKENGFETEEVEHSELTDHIEDAVGLMVGTEKVGRELIEKAKALKVISRYGIGYDAIDLKAASERGIVVTNAPGCNSNAVAELTIMDMLYCSRNIYRMNQGLRSKKKVRPLGTQIEGKKLGIIGVGTIGSIVALKCRALGMEVWCNDIKDKDEFYQKNGLVKAEKEEIYRNCDIITVHVPKTELTAGMIDREQIEMMKEDVILINTARGGIINETALYDALSEGRIRAAALDVSVEEPAFDNPLVQLDNCLFTPHAGASTYEAYQMMHSMAVDNLIEVLKTGTSVNKVN